MAEEAQHRVHLLEAELRGWEGAIALLDTVVTSVQKPSTLRLFGHLRSDLDPDADEVGEDGRPRRVKGRWSKLMGEAAKVYPQGLSFDDWESAAERLGVPLNRNTLRSQMSTYTQWGLVERLGDGHYRITPEGATAAGIRLPLPPPSGEAGHDVHDAADAARDAGADVSSDTEDAAADL
ncbi:hypothetical protein [Roseomonas chloroacetimidivorans]|uniref:hypothetical protein n=1 Tax=Roseomonas chloroacetimidivorans TaxID=1766656 RepID=UPI003C767548